MQTRDEAFSRKGEKRLNVSWVRGNADPCTQTNITRTLMMGNGIVKAETYPVLGRAFRTEERGCPGRGVGWGGWASGAKTVPVARPLLSLD